MAWFVWAGIAAAVTAWIVREFRHPQRPPVKWSGSAPSNVRVLPVASRPYDWERDQ